MFREYTIAQFEFLKKVGESECSCVFKTRRIEDDFICVIKVLKDTASNESKTSMLNELGVPKEAEILHGLSLPHIVKCFGWGKIEKSDLNFDCEMDEQSVFIVLEWIEGVTLAESVNNLLFTPDIRKLIFKQLLNVVIYLHKMNVYHGSIFLNNIMITHKVDENGKRTPHLILVDFSRSNYIRGEGVEDEDYFEKNKIDKWQCGGVLLSLFSSTNVKNNQISTKFLPKDVGFWVHELMDCTKQINLQKIINSPFFEHNETITFSHKSSFSSIQGLDDYIIENILIQLIDSGDLRDLFNAQLVCTHFFNIIQRIFLFYKRFPHIKQHDFPKNIADWNRVKEIASLPSTEFLAFIKNIRSLYVTFDIKTLDDYASKRNQYKRKLTLSYLSSVQGNLMHIETLLSYLESLGNFGNSLNDVDELKESWETIRDTFFDLKEWSEMVGSEKTFWVISYIEQRAMRNKEKKDFYDVQFEEECELFFDIAKEIRKIALEFSMTINIYLTF